MEEEDTGRGAGPRPSHLAAAAAGLLQPCVCSGRRRAAAGAAAPAVGRWEGWQAGREWKVASWSGRKGEVQTWVVMVGSPSPLC